MPAAMGTPRSRVKVIDENSLSRVRLVHFRSGPVSNSAGTPRRVAGKFTADKYGIARLDVLTKQGVRFTVKECQAPAAAVGSHCQPAGPELSTLVVGDR